MELIMKVILRRIEWQEKEYYIIDKDNLHMTESGSMIISMGKEFSLIKLHNPTMNLLILGILIT
jgi:hypothetical protein